MEPGQIRSQKSLEFLSWERVQVAKNALPALARDEVFPELVIVVVVVSKIVQAFVYVAGIPEQLARTPEAYRAPDANVTPAAAIPQQTWPAVLLPFLPATFPGRLPAFHFVPPGRIPQTIRQTNAEYGILQIHRRFPQAA
jgi:hypothetical protein